MPDLVRITDVSPRDGLQNEPAIIPARDKARLISLLAAANVDEIEAASFVSPRWIPQLADAEVTLGLLRENPPAGTRLPTLTVLVPNTQGFERALAIHNAGMPLKIGVFTAASETFSKKNTNASIHETIDRFAEFLPRVFESGMGVRMYVSCAISCPFEGAIQPLAVRRVVNQLLALAAPGAPAGTCEIDLADTIGVAHPADVASLLSEFSDEERAAMTLHFHDTFSRAADCVRLSLDLGVRSFDASVAGLGGCPYAGSAGKRAPGNIATDTLLRAIRSEGFTTNVDENALAKAADFARAAIARAQAEQVDAHSGGRGGGGGDKS